MLLFTTIGFLIKPKKKRIFKSAPDDSQAVRPLEWLLSIEIFYESFVNRRYCVELMRLGFMFSSVFQAMTRWEQTTRRDYEAPRGTNGLIIANEIECQTKH